MNIITVHAEVKRTTHSQKNVVSLQALCHRPALRLSQVFTVSKDLVPRVLSKIVESVADEMCRLMQCVSSFSKNGALQVRRAMRNSHP